MSTFECDGGKIDKRCTNKVDVGESNPSLVICGDCNGNGQAFWNCVDAGNHSCECSYCGPSGYTAETQPQEPEEGTCLECGDVIENLEKKTGQRRDAGILEKMRYCDDDCEFNSIPF